MVETWRGRLVHYRVVRGKYTYPYVHIGGRDVHIPRSLGGEISEVEGEKVRKGGMGGGTTSKRRGSVRGVMRISDEEATTRMKAYVLDHPDWAGGFDMGEPTIIPDEEGKPTPNLQRYIDAYEKGREGLAFSRPVVTEKELEELRKRMPGHSFVSGGRYAVERGKGQRLPPPIRPSRRQEVPPAGPSTLLTMREED